MSKITEEPAGSRGRSTWGGFFLRENVFWRKPSAFFLINRVRQLQFAPIGAIIVLQGFIFGSTVRSIGVPPDLNLYTL